MARKQWPRWIIYSWFASMSLFGPAAQSQQTDTPKDSPPGQSNPKRSAWLHEVYLREALEYDFYLDAKRQQRLDLRREPAMRWTSAADYHGEVFVWTDHGAAVIVGWCPCGKAA